MLLCELGQRDMLSRCPCLLLPGDIINRGSTTSINDPRSIMDKAGTDCGLVHSPTLSSHNCVSSQKLCNPPAEGQTGRHQS